jgi:signal transduction histidine kinase
MDRLRMEQAIDNVVGNSYKYAKTDVHVSFETFAVEMPSGDGGKLKKAGFLRIRIKDSGPGVSEEDLPLIAEKFYRGSNAEKVPGSGLGFYLVKYYMEKQGGGMEYYNDNGLTVELMLRKV